MKKDSNLSQSDKIRIGILIVLHLVGLIGFSIQSYFSLFQFITPFHLVVISFVLLFHKPVLNKQFALFFVLSFVIGFAAEVIGVKSGLLFGYYAYSDVLGFKFLDVPIALGVLWAGTAYAANEIANKIISSWVAKVVLAALIMVLFDFLLEPFAIKSGLWHWNTSSIPNYNYISWMGVGLVLSCIYQYLVKIEFNKVAPYFLLIQMVFFIAFQFLNGMVAIGF